MKDFKKRLNELIKESNINIDQIKNYLNLKSPSIIYFWLDGTYAPKLKYLNKLANLFECSIDYLVGISNDFYETKTPHDTLPKFDERLKSIIENKKLTKTTLRKQNIISGSLYRSIFERKSDPTIETLLKLADYLNISIDYLVGRE